MQPPDHLTDESKRIWERVVDMYEMTADAELLLRCALENFDRAQAARALVSAEGLVKAGKRHPACDIEKVAYGLFQRFMRQLGLDLTEPGEPGRPSTNL